MQNERKVQSTRFPIKYFQARWTRALFAGVLLFSLFPAQSFAWGRVGHRLTAKVAEEYLTPEAKAQIKDLLDGQTIADVASWADDYRSEHPETGPWHYVDIPQDAAGFDRQRDCPASTATPPSPWRDCVTDRILYFEDRLGDTALSHGERAMALKFLVHLISDVHQPFHAYGGDRGGNNVHVTYLGSKVCGNYNCNLHGVWDEQLIDSQGLNDKRYTELLMAKIKENHWERLAGGEPTSWATVSHHYAVQALAPDGALITHEYAKEEVKVVDAELALGGLRLAHVLNRILAAAPADVPAK